MTLNYQHLRVSGIVLASGMSRRFGEGNKLLATIDGLPVVARTVTAFVNAGLEPVYVVVGHQADQILHALSSHAVVPVYNPEFIQGQSRSLVRGLGAVPADVDAAVIGVADQPFLRSDDIKQLASIYRRLRALIVAPRYAGLPGNPVLFGRSLFPELLQVTGDQGGRSVLRKHGDDIVWCDFAEARAGADIDTPQDLEELL